MNDERLLGESDDGAGGDDVLKGAFRSVHDAYDGRSAEANATLQRALFRTRTQVKKQRITRWVVVPMAAALFASTAWAGVTGRLMPAVRSVVETLHPEASPPVAASPPLPTERAAASALPVEPPAVEPPAVEPASAVEAAVEPAPARVAVISARPVSVPPAPKAPSTAALPNEPSAPPAIVVAAPEPSAPEPAPVASAPDPHAALFAEAHRLHFIDRDPARALVAWDRYLAVAPSGRFSPEARYNRALALVRLGRTAEAKAELGAFASGTYGSYRRDDAKTLLDALGR